MKIGLFFGSFNPIHTGHLIIGEHIASFYSDKVWFVVSPQNPFKKNADLLPIKSRLQLANAAINGNNKFSVSDVELTLPLPSYTIDTLKHLKSIYTNYEFFIIMGSDNFLTISSWKSSDILLSEYKIIVYERPGFFIRSQNLNQNIIFANAPLINISSTEIRQLINIKKSIKYLVPEIVASQINKNKYYH